MTTNYHDFTKDFDPKSVEAEVQQEMQNRIFIVQEDLIVYLSSVLIGLQQAKEGALEVQDSVIRPLQDIVADSRGTEAQQQQILHSQFHNADKTVFWAHDGKTIPRAAAEAWSQAVQSHGELGITMIADLQLPAEYDPKADPLSNYEYLDASVGSHGIVAINELVHNWNISSGNDMPIDLGVFLNSKTKGISTLIRENPVLQEKLFIGKLERDGSKSQATVAVMQHIRDKILAKKQ